MRFKSLTYLLALSFFTGSLDAQNKKNDKISAEELFIQNNFPLQSPAKWKPGERFIYVNPTLNITLKAEKQLLEDTTNYQNKLFFFSGVKEQSDWSGNSTLDLIFESGAKKYRFESGKSLAQFSDTTYNPLISGLIWLPEIEKADSLLKGRNCYILSSEWLNQNEDLLKFARKFVSIEITGVKPGNEFIPAFICFKDDKGREYAIGTTLSGTLNSSSRFKFHRIISFTNPREKYKDISDENWQLITEGKLANGMTQAEVRLSIGKPTEINRIPTYSGLREQWLYNSGTMIQFQDGRITNFRR